MCFYIVCGGRREGLKALSRVTDPSTVVSKQQAHEDLKSIEATPLLRLYNNYNPSISMTQNVNVTAVTKFRIEPDQFHENRWVWADNAMTRSTWDLSNTLRNYISDFDKIAPTYALKETACIEVQLESAKRGEDPEIEFSKDLESIMVQRHRPEESQPCFCYLFIAYR